MKKLIAFCICLLFAACALPPPADSGGPLEGRGAVLTVHGMSRPLCSNNLDGRLKKVSDAETVRIDLATGAVTVTFLSSTAPTQRPRCTPCSNSKANAMETEIAPCGWHRDFCMKPALGLRNGPCAFRCRTKWNPAPRSNSP